MAAILVEQPPKDRILKSYFEYSLNQCDGGLRSDLEAYSPTIASLFDTALNQIQTWTPKLVQETVLSGAVDSIDYIDQLIVVGLDKCETLKDKLTAEQVREIVEEIKNGAGTKVVNLAEYLPSAKIEDYELKEQVEAIITKILSRPQIIKDQAAGLAANVRSTLDKDKDGKVTVKDLAENVVEVTKSATWLVSSTYTSVSSAVISNLQEVIPTSSVEEYLPMAEPYINTLKSQWERREEVLNTFLPLWSAIEVLKTYVSLYTSNIQSKFEPLSPYLMELLGNTSVIDVPLEIVQVLQTATGFVSDKERDSVVRETRALFWALIDISFLLEILKQEKKVEKSSKKCNAEGVTMVEDKEESNETPQLEETSI